jgi:hypothetical protein
MRSIHHSSDEICLQHLLRSSFSNCWIFIKTLALGFGPKFITRELNIVEAQDATIAHVAYKSQVTTYNRV